MTRFKNVGLSFYTHLPTYEDGAECSETSAYELQTPGNYPEESIQHTEHAESFGIKNKPMSVGRGSSVGIATCYWLDVPEIESQWRRDIPRPSRRALGPTQPPCTGSFTGVKRPGRGVDHLRPSSAEVEERVELYLYSTSGPSWSVLR